jgi:colicin import membrane protein
MQAALLRLNGAADELERELARRASARAALVSSHTAAEAAEAAMAREAEQTAAQLQLELEEANADRAQLEDELDQAARRAALTEREAGAKLRAAADMAAAAARQSDELQHRVAVSCLVWEPARRSGTEPPTTRAARRS